MCRREGGMDIETLAVERPDALARVAIDPVVGLERRSGRLGRRCGRLRPGRSRSDLRNVLVRLGGVYQTNDATLVEVNPLVKTGDGRIVALEGKVTLDGNAPSVTRSGQPTTTRQRTIRWSDALETKV